MDTKDKEPFFQHSGFTNMRETSSFYKSKIEAVTFPKEIRKLCKTTSIVSRNKAKYLNLQLTLWDFQIHFFLGFLYVSNGIFQ